MEIKRIATKDYLEKKRKRNYLIMGIVMVLLMVISPAAYGLFYNTDSSSSSNTNSIVKYNNIKFTKDANGNWAFSNGGRNFLTRYNPIELNGTKSSIMFTISSYQDQVLSFEWNESQDAVYEIRRNLEGNTILKRVVSRVCLTENCTGDIPTKNCAEDYVISFRVPTEGENERVYKEDNCVFIVANSTNQVKYADAFLFNIIGI